MNKRSGTSKDAADKLVRGIKRKTGKHYLRSSAFLIIGADHFSGGGSKADIE